MLKKIKIHTYQNDDGSPFIDTYYNENRLFIITYKFKNSLFPTSPINEYSLHYISGYILKFKIISIEYYQEIESISISQVLNVDEFWNMYSKNFLFKFNMYGILRKFPQ